MSTKTRTPIDRTGSAPGLRLAQTGIVLAIVGIVAMLATMFSTQGDDGPFRSASDYILTAAAVPQGIGLFLTVLGIHRLQAGRDGRLATAGLWVYGVCTAELVVQCAASLVARAELIWGPLYPLCTFGLAVGLVLFAVGSWRVGLVPRWMLVVWPLLAVIGSFLAVGPVPILYVGFLVTLAVILPRRVSRASAATPAAASTETLASPTP